ncbi:MAG: hypothetical protein AB8B47_04900 [Roseobacter sp.]
MRISVSALLVSVLVVSGCSTVRDSRVNPFNWFGNDEPTATAPVNPDEVNPLIPQNTSVFEATRAERARYKGAPIAVVSDVKLERVPGGVIITATGLTDTQGYFEPQLTPENVEELPVDGVLTYRLEAVRGEASAPQGSEASRRVIVGRQLTDQELSDTTIIRVVAVQNAVEVRRR